MNLKTQKRLASEIIGAGISRVKVSNDKDVMEALTREDVRRLIDKGKIWIVQKKGTSRRKANYIMKQKKKGLRRGSGSKKCSLKQIKRNKWIERIRALRKLLKELRDSGKLNKKDYRKLYRMAKGNMFRSKRHMMLYIKDNNLLRSTKE